MLPENNLLYKQSTQENAIEQLMDLLQKMDELGTPGMATNRGSWADGKNLDSNKRGYCSYFQIPVENDKAFQVTLRKDTETNQKYYQIQKMENVTTHGQVLATAHNADQLKDALEKLGVKPDMVAKCINEKLPKIYEHVIGSDVEKAFFRKIYQPNIKSRTGYVFSLEESAEKNIFLLTLKNQPSDISFGVAYQPGIGVLEIDNSGQWGLIENREGYFKNFANYISSQCKVRKRLVIADLKRLSGEKIKVLKAQVTQEIFDEFKKSVSNMQQSLANIDKQREAVNAQVLRKSTIGLDFKLSHDNKLYCGNSQISTPRELAFVLKCSDPYFTTSQAIKAINARNDFIKSIDQKYLLSNKPEVLVQKDTANKITKTKVHINTPSSNIALIETKKTEHEKTSLAITKSDDDLVDISGQKKQALIDSIKQNTALSNAMNILRLNFNANLKQDLVKLESGKIEKNKTDSLPFS